MTNVRNKPTAEGRAVGHNIAHLTTEARAALEKQLGPETVREVLPQPCNSCAFRAGTFPNGCTETVLDALKCVMEGVPFYCHQSPSNGKGGYTGLCAGYLTARTALIGKQPVPTPWPFSHEQSRDDETET